MSRPVLAGALSALALVAVAGCSSPASGPSTTAPSAGASTGAPASAAAAGQGQPDQALASAGQGAAALGAFGALGQGQGASDQVRSLGGDLAAQGQALQQQISSMSGGAAAQPSAQTQALLDDLKARSGQAFDQAWLGAAGQFQQQARDAANAVLNDPNASADAKNAAKAVLARLDALSAQTRQAASAAGAQTPSSVNAGNGGQAAEDGAVPAMLLLGAGVALVGAGALTRKRSAS